MVQITKQKESREKEKKFSAFSFGYKTVQKSCKTLKWFKINHF